MGLFPYHPADLSAIQADASRLDAEIVEIRVLKRDVDEGARQAYAEVWGELREPVEGMPRPVTAQADEIARAGTLAAGCLRMWAAAVTAYNGEVDKANQQWRDALAAGTAVPDDLDPGLRAAKVKEIEESGRQPVYVSTVKVIVAAAEDTLDVEALKVRRLLEKGPGADTFQTLLTAGHLPPDTPLLFPEYRLKGGAGVEQFARHLRQMVLSGHPEKIVAALAKLPELAGIVEEMLGGWHNLPRLADEQFMADFTDRAMRNPEIAHAMHDAFGFHYVKDGDYYTTGEHSLQSYAGFHDFYDEVGPLLGMQLDDKKIEFTSSNGKEYRIELWKGSYGWGGDFGGEFGIYTRDPDSTGLRGFLEENIEGYSSTAQGSDQVHVTQTIYDKRTGEELFTNDAAGADGTDKEHYWNLAIRSQPGMTKDDLGQRATIQGMDPQLADEMYAAMKAQSAPPGEPGLHVTQEHPGGPIHYTWDE